MVRDLGQHSEQRAGHHDGTRIPQRRASLTLGVHLRRAVDAQRQVVRSPEVSAHPQLAVDEGRDGFGGQMLSGAESAGADGLVALRRELSR